MAEEHGIDHGAPSDLEQIPIVWKYELLKYLRSKRLLGAVALTAVVLVLIYFLPPLLGQPYSGTDSNVDLYFPTDDLTSGAMPGGGAFEGAVGMLNRTQVDLETLRLYLNGTEYPAGENGANWFVMKITYEGQNVYLILFAQNVTAYDVTATYEWYTSPQAFETVFLNFASILVVICATFFGADALVSEFQNRTGYLVFPNPIKREVLLLGKFAASMTAGLLVVVLFYSALAGMSMFTSRGVDDDYLLSFVFAAGYLMAATAVAYLISCVLKGTTGATVLTFFLFVMILPIVDGISLFAGVKIEASLTFAAGALIYVLIDPYPTDWSQEMPGGFSFTNFYPTPETAALVLVAYTVVALLLSMFLFKRRQLAG